MSDDKQSKEEPKPEQDPIEKLRQDVEDALMKKEGSW